MEKEILKERKKAKPQTLSLPHKMQEGNTLQLSLIPSVGPNLLNPRGPLYLHAANLWLKAFKPCKWRASKACGFLQEQYIKGEKESTPSPNGSLNKHIKDHEFTEVIVLVTGSCNWLLWLSCLETDSFGPRDHCCVFYVQHLFTWSSTIHI